MKVPERLKEPAEDELNTEDPDPEDGSLEMLSPGDFYDLLMEQQEQM